jgi:hypothetical protein
MLICPGLCDVIVPDLPTQLFRRRGRSLGLSFTRVNHSFDVEMI